MATISRQDPGAQQVILCTAGGTGLLAQKEPYMHAVGTFGVEVRKEIEAAGLQIPGPVFPISPSNLNASDLISQWSNLPEVGYNFPKELAQWKKYLETLLPYMERYFQTHNSLLYTGLSQMPVLGSFAAFWQLISEYDSCIETIHRYVIVPLRAATQGAPTALSIISVASNSGGTGGGTRPLVESLLLQQIEETFGGEIQKVITRVSPDPLMTFDGLGENVEDNAMMLLVRDLAWMIVNQPFTTKQLVYFTQNSYMKDAAARQIEQMQLLQVVSDPTWQSIVNSAINNMQGANAFSKAMIWVPSYYDNCVNTQVALAAVARKFHKELNSNGVSITPIAITLVSKATPNLKETFKIEALVRGLETRTEPSTYFIAQAGAKFHVEIEIPQLVAFGNQLLGKRNLADIKRVLHQIECLEAGIEEQIEALTNSHRNYKPGESPKEKLQEAYDLLFETAPVDEEESNTVGFLGNITRLFKQSATEMTRQEAIRELCLAIEAYRSWLKEEAVIEESLTALAAAKKALQKYTEDNSALLLFNKISALLKAISSSEVVAEDIVETSRLTDFFDPGREISFYEALGARVEEPQAFNSILAAAIKWPSPEGYKWMLNIPEFTPEAIAKRIQHARVVSPYWGGRPGKNVIHTVYFPGLPNELAAAIGNSLGKEWIVVPGTARASMMAVVQIDVTVASSVADLFPPSILAGVRRALKNPKVWLRFPGFERLDQQDLDLINDGLRDSMDGKRTGGLGLHGENRLVLPPVLQDLLDKDKEAGL
jgi:hypothetical protein